MRVTQASSEARLQAGLTIFKALLALVIISLLAYGGINIYQHSRALAQLERVRGQINDFLSRLSVHKMQHQTFTVNFADLGGVAGSEHASGATGYRFTLAVCPEETLATCVQITARPGPNALTNTEIVADTRQGWVEGVAAR